MSVPKKLVAGDTWRLLRSFSDYPAPTWTVTYYFENETHKFSAVAAASGTDHAVTIAAATTATYAPGKYRWFARASAAGIVETIEDETGWLDVGADPAATGLRDQRTWAQRTLEALEATLEGRATSDQLAMSINGRSISRTPITELTAWRDKLRAEARADVGGSTASKGRYIKVRLSRA